MGIKRIFISHATADAAVATELREHLRNAGHEAQVDTQDLGLGDDLVEFMNDGIANAHVVIILFSQHTPEAKWQNAEIHAAIATQVTNNGARCIVVRLDDTPIPPLLGSKVYGRLEASNRTSLKTLVEKICQDVFDGPSTSSIVAEAFRRDSRNPFRHLRAEFFEDEPGLHAKTFALPDAIKVGALEEMKPCILEGSRGTGKSMLLLSLRARNFLQRQPTERSAPPRFGFYLKLTRGATCNAGIRFEATPLDDTVDSGILLDVAEQELTLQITESLFSELEYCAKYDLLACGSAIERSLCNEADELLFDTTQDQASSFGALQKKLTRIHKRLAEFIRRRFIYGEQFSVPVATFDLAQLKRVVELVRRNLSTLHSSKFVVLLDEYENLYPYQQKVVNGFVKLGPPDVSVKIAKKLASGNTPATTTGQELQEIHDYTRVPLVYNLEDPAERRAYQELLRHIVENMVALEDGRPFDMNTLLPRFTQPEVAEAECFAEIAKLSKMTIDELRGLKEDEFRKRSTYYGQAATYRVLLGKPGRHREKRFAGFKELALLGSGVIRYFQEFLSVGYHLTFGPGAPPSGALTLPPDCQSRAVHVVSQHNLTTLSRNVERYGEELKYFLLDLGDCLRQKLLKHTSEPEAARLTIEDPEVLGENSMEKLKRILAVGEREGVFQNQRGTSGFQTKTRV